MKYLKNIEDGSIQAVEEGSPAEAALKALRTTPSATKDKGFPLYEEVDGPGTPAVDISGIPTWVAAAFGEGALVKYTGKLYIAKGDVAADADAPDTNPTDWDLIGPGAASGGSAEILPRAAGYRFAPGFGNSGGFAFAGPTLDRLFLTPIWLKAGLLNLIGTHVNDAAGAGGVLRLGLYSEADGQPGSPLVSSAPIATDAGAANKGFDPALTLDADGWYFTACVFQVAAPAIIALASGPVLGLPQLTYGGSPYYLSSSSAWYEEGVTGALPDPYVPAADPTLANAPLVVVGYA